LKQGGIFAPISREGALVFNNLLLTTSCATVFVGTLYPLALEAVTGAKISVGPPFFNLTFAPLFVPLFMAIPLGQLLAWKRGDILGAVQRLSFAIGMAVLAGLILAFARGEPVLSVLFAGLAVYVIVGSFIEIWGRSTAGGFSPAIIWRRAVGLPLSQWGSALAHAGAGVTLFGLAATGWGVERIVGMKAGDNVNLGPYVVTLEDVERRKGPNYVETAAHMTIREGGVVIGKLDPSRKFYSHRSMTTTEAGLRTIQLGQVHIVIPEQNSDGSLDVRLYWKPYVTLIWLGSIVMFIGGGVSLADRRLRIGYARRPRQAKGQPAPVPAE
jgi:cytochrome c-type biogenesis protein CcmF